MLKKTEIVIQSIVGIILAALLALVFWIKIRESYEPSWNPNERWVSDFPNISFVVYDEEKGVPYGQMKINNQIIEVSPAIIYRHVMQIVDFPTIEYGVVQNADILMQGECEFHRNWFTVSVTFDRDGLFEGIDTIIFRKEYIDAS